MGLWVVRRAFFYVGILLFKTNYLEVNHFTLIFEMLNMQKPWDLDSWFLPRILALLCITDFYIKPYYISISFFWQSSRWNIWTSAHQPWNHTSFIEGTYPISFQPILTGVLVLLYTLLGLLLSLLCIKICTTEGF